MTSACLEKRCEKLGINFIFLSYSTFNSDCRSCLVPTSAIKNIQEKGCPMSPAFYFSVDVGGSSYSLHPDPSSFLQVPWDKKLAWVQCNVGHNGEAYEQCPRRVLQMRVAEARKVGLTFKSGIEPEFFVTSQDAKSLHDTIDAQQFLPLHDPSAIYRNLPLLTEIFDCMQALDWKPYQIFHEASNCQYEINFGYDDVIVTADRLCFLKFMCKQLAEKHGARITFMPVPFRDQQCASGMHINLSVWDEKGESSLMTGIEKGVLDGWGGGAGSVVRDMVGGLLKHARDFTAILCSTVNSYKRLNNGSWCPNNISWGLTDKSALIRIPTQDRIEMRLADAATNPHLSHAILIACATEGLLNKIAPPENSEGNDRLKSKEREIPLSFNQALDELQGSEFVRGVLGEKLVDDFVSLKRTEWKAYSQELTEWETRRYMDC